MLSFLQTYAGYCPNYTVVITTINSVHNTCFMAFNRLNLQWRTDQSDPETRNTNVQQAVALVAGANAIMGELGAVVSGLIPYVCEQCVRQFWKLASAVSYMARAVFVLMGDGLQRCEPSDAWPGRVMGGTWDDITAMLTESVRHFTANVPVVQCSA